MSDHRCHIICRLTVTSCLALAAGCAGVLNAPKNLLLEDPLVTGDALSPRVPTGKASDAPKPDFNAELTRGRNLEKVGKHAQARAIYERLVVAYPDRYEPYHGLGIVADRQRRHREAQALYAQAIRLCGSNAELFNDLGYCLYLQGKLEKAEAALMKAVALRPADARYRNNLGLVLGHLGRYDEALTHFRRAGSEADAQYNLAFIHACQDEMEKAKECFRLALTADPTHESARKALASFDYCDENPEALPNDSLLAEDGARWVPYVEGGRREGADVVEPAAQAAPSSSGNRTASARPSTQSLLKHAREMVARRTAERFE